MKRGAIIQIDSKRVELLSVQKRENGYVATGVTADAKDESDGYWFMVATDADGEWRIRRQRPRFIQGAQPGFSESYELTQRWPQ